MLYINASYYFMQFQGKLINQTWENGKNLVMFFKKYGSVMVSYHHIQYQKKLMIHSWENLMTDGQTDGQTDESDFIGRCPTNVKRSIVKFRKGYDTSHKVQRDKKLVFM